MRKNKGYQKDIHHYWHRSDAEINRAKGVNKTLEQYINDINKEFDKRIELCKKEYAIIATKTTLVGKDLRDYCREYSLWEIRFDKNLNLIPLEIALKMNEEDRRRVLGKRLYSKWEGYQKRIIHKDNQKFVYNGRGGSNKNKIRIPSLKRSNSTWKKFYELFPFLKGLDTYRGIKLKKI